MLLRINSLMFWLYLPIRVCRIKMTWGLTVIVHDRAVWVSSGLETTALLTTPGLWEPDWLFFQMRLIWPVSVGSCSVKGSKTCMNEMWEWSWATAKTQGWRKSKWRRGTALMLKYCHDSVTLLSYPCIIIVIFYYVLRLFINMDHRCVRNSSSSLQHQHSKQRQCRCRHPDIYLRVRLLVEIWFYLLCGGIYDKHLYQAFSAALCLMSTASWQDDNLSLSLHRPQRARYELSELSVWPSGSLSVQSYCSVHLPAVLNSIKIKIWIITNNRRMLDCQVLTSFYLLLLCLLIFRTMYVFL